MCRSRTFHDSCPLIVVPGSTCRSYFWIGLEALRSFEVARQSQRRIRRHRACPVSDFVDARGRTVSALALPALDNPKFRQTLFARPARTPPVPEAAGAGQMASGGSAMARSYLGLPLDIHGGGPDMISRITRRSSRSTRRRGVGRLSASGCTWHRCGSTGTRCPSQNAT
jgi:hypothetical protein